MEIIIRIISEIEPGYIISPKEVANDVGTTLSNTDLIDPGKKMYMPVAQSRVHGILEQARRSFRAPLPEFWAQR